MIIMSWSQSTQKSTIQKCSSWKHLRDNLGGAVQVMILRGMDRLKERVDLGFPRDLYGNLHGEHGDFFLKKHMSNLIKDPRLTLLM